MYEKVKQYFHTCYEKVNSEPGQLVKGWPDVPQGHLEQYHYRLYFYTISYTTINRQKYKKLQKLQFQVPQPLKAGHACWVASGKRLGMNFIGTRNSVAFKRRNSSLLRVLLIPLIQRLTSTDRPTVSQSVTWSVRQSKASDMNTLVDSL